MRRIVFAGAAGLRLLSCLLWLFLGLLAVGCKSSSKELVVSMSGEACVGNCSCAPELTLCAETCYDLSADTANCGACGQACAGNQTCEAGACGCAAPLALCGETCTDPASDAANCGSCGNACSGGQVCSAGSCACPEGTTQCGDSCFNLQTANDNCGACGAACSGGQTCNGGSCVCPEGQAFCGGTCLDVLANNDNCGACGSVCGFGEGCSKGDCQSGALGEDGCQGLAKQISINQIAAYQTVEVPLVQSGASVAERVARVVAGRNTLLRVFVTPGAGWQTRELSARLYLESGEKQVIQYSESTLSPAAASTQADRDSTFEFKLAADSITSETRYAVEVVECGAGTGETQSPRFPAEGGVELEAVDAGGLVVNIIPLRANGRLPETTEAAFDIYKRAFLAAYPISDIEFTVHAPVDVADATDWSLNLDTLRSLRQTERPAADVYYYGMLRPTETFREFCNGACTAGIGYVPQQRLSANARVAMGLAFGDTSSVFTMLHEVGHNHGREHAPCVPQGASISDVDPNYPYDDGSIGVYGYTASTDTLLAPEGVSDVMGYCRNRWFSDYTYNGLLTTVLAVNQTQASEYVAPERIGSWRVALVEAARGPRWGQPIPGPAAAEGEEEAASVLDANGVVLERVSVYRTRIGDLDASSVQVPEPKPGWHSIAIQGAAPLVYPAP